MFFPLYFFRETAVQFQIKYDELQNPKTCKHHYGGCFWSKKVGKLWIFMFGAILGKIRTCWPRSRHFRTNFELLLDAKPCFLSFPHQTKLLPNFSDRFKPYSSISEDPIESHSSYFYVVVKLCRNLPENKMSINNSYVVPCILSAGEVVYSIETPILVIFVSMFRKLRFPEKKIPHC